VKDDQSFINHILYEYCLVSKGAKIGIGVGIGVAAFFIIAISIGSANIAEKDQASRTLSVEELQAMSVDWEYDDILRNFEKYYENIIHFQGPLISVDPIPGATDRYGLLVQVGCKRLPDNYDCNYILSDYIGKRLLKDDVVEIFGQVKKIHQMELEIGGETPIPVVKGLRVDCISCP